MEITIGFRVEGLRFMVGVSGFGFLLCLVVRACCPVGPLWGHRLVTGREQGESSSFKVVGVVVG